MSRGSDRTRRTDYGTVILHWALVAALAVAFVTGLRIATEAPDRTWINVLDPILPRASVWTAHIPAAVALVGVSTAYAIYMATAGLGRRIRLDRVRLLGLFGRAQARWGTINVALYWVFYLALLTQLITGAALYFGHANRIMLDVHWIGTWVILGYAVVHVLAHLRLGGAAQLMRILRPAPLAPPPPPFDAAELIARLDRQPERAPPEQEAPRIRRRTRPADPPGPMLQANPFAVAAAGGLVGVMLLVAVERGSVDTLHIHRIASSEAPVLDGDTSDPVWRMARPIEELTEQGGNFDGKGETTVEVRAVHDGTWAYFLFVWNDPTRSLKQLPLIKTATGWRLLHDGYEIGDEHAYSEDKFSVLLTRADAVLAGDATFHAGPTPIADKPRTLSGRGLHYTDGDVVDVWQWKATSTGPFGFMDDDHFGPPMKASPAELSGIAPYRGGFAHDPGTAAYQDNFDPRPPNSYSEPIKPRRLPRDVRAMTAALGPVDLDPARGEAEGARWFMTEAESLPYATELDAAIPLGTIIPGVIVAGRFSGDRSDVRCAARWAAGHWALEVARRLDTGSPYDIAIRTGVFLRVAAFDHSQIRHTRHVRPIRLEVE
jgi:hypothetical protein